MALGPVADLPSSATLSSTTRAPRPQRRGADRRPRWLRRWPRTPPPVLPSKAASLVGEASRGIDGPIALLARCGPAQAGRSIICLDPAVRRRSIGARLVSTSVAWRRGPRRDGGDLPDQRAGTLVGQQTLPAALSAKRRPRPFGFIVVAEHVGQEMPEQVAQVAEEVHLLDGERRQLGEVPRISMSRTPRALAPACRASPARRPCGRPGSWARRGRSSGCSPPSPRTRRRSARPSGRWRWRNARWRRRSRASPSRAGRVRFSTLSDRPPSARPRSAGSSRASSTRKSAAASASSTEAATWTIARSSSRSLEGAATIPAVAVSSAEPAELLGHADASLWRARSRSISRACSWIVREASASCAVRSSPVHRSFLRFLERRNARSVRSRETAWPPSSIGGLGRPLHTLIGGLGDPLRASSTAPSSIGGVWGTL